MEADLSDFCESSFLLSLDLLETLDLFSDTRAFESLVLSESEDVSDLVCCKVPLLPVMPAAENDEAHLVTLSFMHYFIVHFVIVHYFNVTLKKVLLSNNFFRVFRFPAKLINCSFTSTFFSNAILHL